MAIPIKAVVVSNEKDTQALRKMLLGLELDFSFHRTLSELNPPNGTAMIAILYEPQHISDFRALLPSLRKQFPGAAFILIQRDYDESLATEYIQVCSGHYYLLSQLALVPATIRHIIRWQNRSEARNDMIQQQQEALVELATSATLNSGDWDAALKEICSVTSKSLGVSRVSIWLFDTERSKIVCQMLYKLAENEFESGLEILATANPNYFTALNQNRVISASRAFEHPDTREFLNTYLKPLNIYSMLDAPIRVSGVVHGTVCFEQQGEARLWTVDDEVFAGAAADLTALLIESLEYRRIEEAIKHTEKLQSLGLLASGIAHDFNNLLTVLLSQSSQMADLLEKEHPAYKTLMNIVNTTRQASALTKQLLTYAGDKPVQITGIDLTAFMNEHRDLLRLAISPHVELEIAEAKALAIEVDSAQLQQVLMNLVINAAEAMDEAGKISIEFSEEYLTESFAKPHSYKSESFVAGDFVRLTVRDTGQGIEESAIKRVFEPFFSTKANGRGLGLATVLGIIRSHGGVMVVESQVGKGTSFHLYFRKASVESIDKVITSTIPVLMQYTVLVVDDAPEIVESISEILEINGFNTLTAYNGSEAVNLYRTDAHMIDLILVDMSMPGMNGAETFAQLRQIRPDSKVIILSGYNDRDLLRYFPNERPHAILGKPYDVNSLVETVKRSLL
jgi:signal transduction histidine kinase/CheY-like chemotaxis protein